MSENRCTRCGKYAVDPGYIHTCSPPPIVAEYEATIARLTAEVERLRDALTEAPMVALGRTNTAFARWCVEQAQPTAQEAPHAVQ